MHIKLTKVISFLLLLQVGVSFGGNNNHGNHSDPYILGIISSNDTMACGSMSLSTCINIYGPLKVYATELCTIQLESPYNNAFASYYHGFQAHSLVATNFIFVSQEYFVDFEYSCAALKHKPKKLLPHRG